LITNCINCTSWNYCKQCSASFYLKSDFSTCLTDCSSDIYAYPNTSFPTNYRCLLCTDTIPNCIKCINSTQCIQCSASFFLKSNFSTCLVDCSSDIYAYQNTSFPTNYRCLLCTDTMPNCIKCINSTKCIQCSASFYLKSDFSTCLLDCSSDIYAYPNTSIPTNYSCLLCTDTILHC